MNKGVIKAIVFPVVFLIAVIIFEVATNHTNEDLTTRMADATLPVVYLHYDDEKVNELYGYTSEMNGAYMRDTITPVESDRIMPISIDAEEMDIDTISYEIRSMDTTRLVANAEVTEYTQKNGNISTDIEIQNILEEGEEYLMILTLTSGESAVHYYTRIIEPVDSYVKESLDFVRNFHETTFDKDKAQTLATYIEPDGTGDNSTLQKVDIHSSLDQITWANFNGSRLTTPVVSIKEINTSYNVVTMDYVMTTTGESGELEYYNVEEYYRVRYTNDRMYLLNYERTMNQIFRGENNGFYENYIQLGIRDANMQYVASSNGNVVCFVQEGELWSYNASENELSEVFSFRGYEGIDDRENNDSHEIKIIKVNEAGSTDFVVYGYMNRGIHEGQVGVCVYHYDSVANTIEEELFIPSDKSPEVMKSELGKVMYESEDEEFYIMMDGSISRIDLTTMEQTVVVEGLADETCQVSASNQYVAYLEGEDENAGTTIHVLDLETEQEFTVAEGADEYIRPLGFMDNDCIYGIAKKSDVITDGAGVVAFPMYQVKIMDTVSPDHEILKEYHKDGFYISDITISDYTIYLNRIQNNGVAYIATTQDTIMNREGDGDELVVVHTTVTDQKQTQLQLQITDKEEIVSKKLLTPTEIVLEDNRTIELAGDAQENYYFAYARGKVLAATSNVAKAISIANDQYGIVVNTSQEYVWKRAKKTQRSAIVVATEEADAAGSTIAQSISAMLGAENIHIGVQALIDQGDLPKQILADTMQDMEVLDLTGCTLEEALYYVNRGTPVFAMTDNTQAVLLVGYDVNNAIIFNPATDTTYKVGLEDGTDMFAQAGNVFLAYIK